MMNKGEAIKFAKKYLTDRMNERFQGLECLRLLEDEFKVFLEYVEFDIIPYIYGESLD